MDLLTLIVPLILMSLFIVFIFNWLIPEWKNDNRWYRYDDAYKDWERTGRKGVMPTPEDFGWISPKEREH